MKSKTELEIGCKYQEKSDFIDEIIEVQQKVFKENGYGGKGYYYSGLVIDVKKGYSNPGQKWSLTPSGFKFLTFFDLT